MNCGMRVLGVFLVAVVSNCALADSVNLVQDPGFEHSAGSLIWSDFVYSIAVTSPWHHVGTPAILNASGPDGSHCLDLGANGQEVYQDIPTTAGHQYTVSFDYEPPSFYYGGDVSVGFGNDSVAASLRILPNDNKYREYTIAPIAASGSQTRLSFHYSYSGGYPDYGPFLIDDVSVVDNGPAVTAAPLPSAVWAGLALLVGLVARRRILGRA